MSQLSTSNESNTSNNNNNRLNTPSSTEHLSIRTSPNSQTNISIEISNADELEPHQNQKLDFQRNQSYLNEKFKKAEHRGFDLLAPTNSFITRLSSSLVNLVDNSNKTTNNGLISKIQVFSASASNSASGSSTSIAAAGPSVCYICKKKLNTPANGYESIASKFKLWNFGSSSSSSKTQETNMQCCDCLSFACERCGNMTSPDFISTDKSNDVKLIFFRVVKRNISK